MTQPTEPPFAQFEQHIHTLADLIKQRVRTIDLTHYSERELMGAIMIFAIEGLSWCHHHLESEPGTLELIIAQFGMGLRETVAAYPNHQCRPRDGHTGTHGGT